LLLLQLWPCVGLSTSFHNDNDYEHFCNSKPQMMSVMVSTALRMNDNIEELLMLK
jgi:hypothetical protein